LSNFCYGETFSVLPEALPDNTYHPGKYAAINLIWRPFSWLPNHAS
jgi:hypothetical protein